MKDLRTKVLEEIRKSKADAEKLADDNLRLALKNDEFKNLYNDLKSLEIKIARQEFLGQKTEVENQEKIVLVQKLNKILKPSNLTLEDFFPKYSCKKCDDKALVGDKYCSCYYKKLNEAILKNIGASIDPSHSFNCADFSIFDKPSEVKKLYTKLNAWCDDVKNSKYKNVLLSGATGVGKTYLVECVCNKLLEQNVVINFYSAFALNNLFLKFHTTFDGSKSSILADVLDCDVLIIDDLGVEPKYKNVTNEYMYLILNERLTKNKSTIITTNLTPMDIIDSYGERVFSRICNKKVSMMIKMENSDLRIKKQ